MRKLKVYLDTSVISHLMQEDVPEKMAITQELWTMFCAGEYDIYLSIVTTGELMDCPEPKRSGLMQYLDEIQYALLPVTDETVTLANKIIDMGVLTRKSFDDSRHIAAALIGDCDCIVSWHFKHLVNIRTIHGVRAIANLEGYRPIDIVSPETLLEGDYE